ncbi:MAG: hypothetical protein IJC86_00730 [Clostridia bacterium]|nr:hypothetical protein [Clostridia bacterium]
MGILKYRNKIDKFIKSSLSTNLLFAIMVASVFVLSLFFVKTEDDYTLTEKYKFIHAALHSLRFGNGRYLGNFFVRFFLNREMVDKICRSVCYCAVILLTALLTDGYRKRALIFSYILYMGMGTEIYSQVFVWGHGFYNFTPPIVIMLFSVYLLKRFYDSDGSKSFFLSCLLAVMGFCQQLFAENCTTVNLLISGIILVFVIRNKYLHKMPSIVYFVLSVFGAMVMFLLPELMGVSYKMDSYRGIHGISEYMCNGVENMVRILNDMSSQVILWLLFSIVFTILIRQKELNIKRNCGFAQVYLLLFPILSLVQSLNSSVAVHLIIDAVFVGYCVLLVHLVFELANKELRTKCLIMLTVTTLSMLQLLVVKPCRARCLFLPYVLLVIVLLSIGKELFSKLNYVTVFRTTFVGVVACVLICGLLIFIHVNIWKVNNVRVEYANEQIANGLTKVEIINLPYSRWLHYGNESYAYGYTFNQGNKDEMLFTYIDYDEYLHREQKFG